MPFVMTDFGIAVDCNERYVVISHREYGIWRFSLHNGLWDKSSVSPPTDARHSIAILGGSSVDGLAFRKSQGYCKFVIRCGGFKMLWTDGKKKQKMQIPYAALYIICEFLEETEEYVHCVDLTNGGHWRYHLRDLFYSVETRGANFMAQPPARRKESE